MEPITSRLPPELLARVFFFLSERRTDISSSRLVCRAFKDCSSPYLITRVVFAKRLKDISNLQEILEHPYFHKHVTELVYDASTYDELLAYNWTRFVQECERAPRYLHDTEQEERTSREQGLLAKIESSSGAYEAEMNPEDENIDDRLHAARYYNRVYSLGCHKTLPDYQRMFDAQTKIEKAHLPFRVIRQALSGFPALKSVVLTDWRTLAFSGESYDECTSRFFGNTLAPKYFGGNNTGDLYTLIRAVESSPGARVESLQIGRHNFEDEEVRTPYDLHPSKLCYVSISNISANPGFVSDGRLMGNVRRLDLQIYVPEHKSDLCDLLQNALALTSLRIYLQPVPDRDEGEYGHFASATEVCDWTLTHLHLPKLRVLDLQNWRLFHTPLKIFLEKHSSSLRILKFRGCDFTPDDISNVPKWAGKNLQLDGIDLESSAYHMHLDELPFLDRVDMENLWLSNRQNFVERKREAKIVGYSDDGGEYQRSGDHPYWSERRV